MSDEEIAYVGNDKAVVDDILNALKDKREKYCKHCQYAKGPFCRRTFKKIPVDKINYCSRWFREES